MPCWRSASCKPGLPIDPPIITIAALDRPSIGDIRAAAILLTLGINGVDERTRSARRSADCGRLSVSSVIKCWAMVKFGLEKGRRRPRGFMAMLLLCSFSVYRVV